MIRRRDVQTSTAPDGSALTHSIAKVMVSGFALLALAGCSGGDAEQTATEAATATTNAPESDFVSAEEPGATTASGDDAPDALADADTEPAAEGDDPAPDTTGDDEGETPDAVDPNSPAAPAGAPEYPARYSINSGGKLYVRGGVPSQDIADAIVVAAEQIMGPGNVIDEYTIDPDIEFDPNASSPVFVDEAILFETGSAVIAPAFYPLLAPTPLLLQLQPTVSIEIIGYTDSRGDDASNLALSQARVDAVRDWIIENGGDADRIVATGAGESNPVASNDTEEGRAANRRVEVIITGFQFG